MVALVAASALATATVGLCRRLWRLFDPEAISGQVAETTSVNLPVAVLEHDDQPVGGGPVASGLDAVEKLTVDLHGDGP